MTYQDILLSAILKLGYFLSAVIQRKGLVLLQLLLDEVDLSTRDDLSSDLAKVITAAMSQNEEEIGLQTEVNGQGQLSKTLILCDLKNV